MKGSSAARRWGRCLKAPVRVLCSVPNLYIKCMNGCAGRARCGGGSMDYQATMPEFSRSYSFSSVRPSARHRDLREPIGGVSRTQTRVRRSRRVVMGRIDEDEPCEFKEDVMVGTDLLFPRSRNYAAGVKRRTKSFAD